MPQPLLLRWVFFLSSVLVLVSGGWILYNWPTTLSIAVGHRGSSLSAYVGEISDALAKNRDTFRLKIVPTAGSEESSKLLDAKKVDLAILRSDDESSNVARALVVLQRKTMFVIARAPKKPVTKSAAQNTGASATDDEASVSAAKPADKPEKKAGKASPKSAKKKSGKASGDEDGTPQFLDLIGKMRGATLSRVGTNDQPIILEAMQHYDKGRDAKKWPALDRNSAEKAFIENKLDFLVLLAHPSEPAVKSLIRSVRKALGKQFVMLSLPAPKGLAYQLKHLESSTLPAGVFGGNPPQPAEDLEAVAITYELVASARLGERSAALLTKSLTDLRTQLRGTDDGEFNIELPSVEEPRRFLPHAGTIAQINSESKTFWDQYSDLIWLALFSLGIAGSALSTLLSWLGLRRTSSGER